MPYFMCKTCGVQYPESPEPPAECPICEDERQYVPPEGQRWTTLEELRAGHRADIRAEEPGLTGIGCKPSFAIGQRALLVHAPSGNVLWDCISLLDEEIVERVRELGGIGAIAISHPHYYSSMIGWSRAFDAPVYIHAGDREWVMRPDEQVVFWEEETRELGPGLTLVHGGGHFAGGAMLHWAGGAEGRGVLLTGDIIQVIPDRSFVSFMWSYPNLIPLPAREVRHVAGSVEPFAFDRIYGAWWERIIPEDAKAVVARSAERYISAIGE